MRPRILSPEKIQWLNDQLPENSMRNGRIRPGRVQEWADALGIKVNTLRGYIRKGKTSNRIGEIHAKWKARIDGNSEANDAPHTPE